jgi:hypothetical protein
MRTRNRLLLLHLQTELFYYYKQFSVHIILPLLCVYIHIYIDGPICVKQYYFVCRNTSIKDSRGAQAIY